MSVTLADILDEKRQDWPKGACSKVVEIKDYSGVCGRCGWSIEDHEYLMDAEEFIDNDGNPAWAIRIE